MNFWSPLSFALNLGMVSILSTAAFAQTPQPSPTPIIIKTPTKRIVVPQKGQSSGNKFVTGDSVKEPTKFRATYIAEYEGNRFFKPLNEVTSPTGSVSGASLTHDMRVGYEVLKRVTVGIRPRWTQSLNPNFDPASPQPTFTALDLRLYSNWGAMVETDDIRIDGAFQFELPTSDASQASGRIVRFNLSTNIVFKTGLRNWYFATVVVASPRFHKVNSPTTNDFGLVAVPIISVDIAPKVQLQFEGALITNHLFGSSFFDFELGADDYFNIGPVFNLGDHFSLNPAIRFYLANLSFTTATSYLNFSVSL